jgi:hypothetical protein
VIRGVKHPFERKSRSIARSKWVLLQRAGIALFIACAVLFGVISAASATGPTDGSIVLGATQTVGTITTGTPFSSGQAIDIVIPANSVFVQTASLHIVECSAPRGVIPTDPSTCDGNTIQGTSLSPKADGSVDLEAQKGLLYNVYALPDLPSLGESSGPVCNLTTECIIYIGYDYNDFTQPHFWSSPFYVAPNATDSGANPGDGSAPPVPVSASPSLSTVVATPSKSTADGEDASTVTVTLLANGNVPVSGKAVKLSASTGTAVVSAPVTSNGAGVASFSVTDSVAEPVTLTATDTTDIPSVTVAQTALITFQTPTVNSANSQVSASPTAVPNGGAITTITVTLRDQAADPQPVANQVVSLSGTGSSVIVPASTPDTTNASGVATFTATDSVAELVKYTATDVTDGVTLAGKASVIFGTLVVSPTQSTLSVTSPAEVGAAGTTAVVTLMTAGGSSVAGKMVTLAASSATAALGPAAVTNADGQARFSVSDSAVDSVTLTATDTTDALAIPQTATLLFEIPTPSSTQSTISSSTTTSPADGATQTPISVVMRDQFGDPLSGITVQLAATPSTSVEFRPISIGSSTPGITDATGTAQFEADDTTAETVTFTATDTTDGIPVAGSVVVTYTAGDADANQSTSTSNPTQVPADGTSPSVITVTVSDHLGNPVPGIAVALSPLNGNSVITTVNATTGADGQATFSVTDASQEVVTYSITDTTDNLLLSSQPVVVFGNPPAPPPVPADSALVASANSVPADGASTAMITVLLFDGSANAVAGKTVTLTPESGNSKVTAVSAVTGNTGTALFSVSDSDVESVTYTATDTTDDVSLDPQDVVVNFTTAASATPGIAASGSGSGTTTSTTTTTTPSSAGTGSSSTGSEASASGTGAEASLAFTGLPTLLPWLIGLGALLILIGSLGRRLALDRSR